MSLRSEARSILSDIMHDKETAFGFDLTVINPNSESEVFIGRSQDIAQLIDPDTGQAVSGRLVSVVFVLSDFLDFGWEIPVETPSIDENPWLVSYQDENGTGYTFKVVETNPDRTLNTIICMLEFFDSGT